MIIELLTQYKNLTEEIIKSLQNDDETNLMEQREKLLKEIFSQGFSKEEIKSAYISLGIEESDLKLKKSLEKEMIETKNELREIQVRKNASRGYTSNVKNMNIFSAKI